MKVYTLLIITTIAAAAGMFVFVSSNNKDDVIISSSLRRHRRRLGFINDPHTTVLKPQLEDQLPQCPRRDLSEFSLQTVGYKFVWEVSKTLEGSNCLFFDCNHDINECDNGDATNYDGPKKPCCTHILRDMNRIFDEEMCRLGLDYAAGFGTLLGLVRADRFIPWSVDSDILINSREAMNALVLLWDSKKTGLSHHYSKMNRMCVNPDFAGGALMKWARPQCGEQNHFFYNGGCFEWDSKWDAGFPYIDLYLGQPEDDYNMFSMVKGKCRHLYVDVFPTHRQRVYSGQFTMNFPSNPDQLLRTYYGKRWRLPPSDEEKKEHGNRMCPYGPTA
ncbi:hypothetical protein ACHAXM_000492 [Skeletonema potamos]